MRGSKNRCLTNDRNTKNNNNGRKQTDGRIRRTPTQIGSEY